MSAVRHVRFLAQRQNWHCIWCEFPMGKDNDDCWAIIKSEVPQGRYVAKGTIHRLAHHIRASFEHVVPKSLGGSDDLENGLAACRWCNNFRGAHDPEQFKARMMRILAAKAHPRQQFRLIGRWVTEMASSSP